MPRVVIGPFIQNENVSFIYTITVFDTSLVNKVLYRITFPNKYTVKIWTKQIAWPILFAIIYHNNFLKLYNSMSQTFLYSTNNQNRVVVFV